MRSVVKTLSVGALVLALVASAAPAQAQGEGGASRVETLAEAPSVEQRQPTGDDASSLGADESEAGDAEHFEAEQPEQTEALEQPFAGGAQRVQGPGPLPGQTPNLQAGAAGAPVAASAGVTQEIFTLVNQYRAQYGRPPLGASAAIGGVAQRWSENQARDNAWSHNPNFLTEIPAGVSSAGENVAVGFGGAVDVMNFWTNSPAHRNNLLGDFSHIGIGVATSGTGRLYYTQVFAKYTNGVPDERLPYSDVARSHTHYAGILWMYEHGYVASAFQFYPGNETTRGAMATMLMRMKEPDFQPSAATVQRWPYGDIGQNHTHYRGIAWMYERGYAARAYRFNAGNPVTRGAMATFLQRMEEPNYQARSSLRLQGYADVQPSDTHYRGIAWMAHRGYAAKASAYNAGGSTGRGAMSTFLWRIYR